MSAARPPALLVAIDTEGDNQWDAHARRHQTFVNIHRLDRLHEFFARHGVRPTYVITYPVARDPQSAAMLRTLLARGECVLIFSEGTRIRPGALGRPKRGVGRLALETGAPVVPVAVIGTE